MFWIAASSVLILLVPMGLGMYVWLRSKRPQSSLDHINDLYAEMEIMGTLNGRPIPPGNANIPKYDIDTLYQEVLAARAKK